MPKCPKCKQEIKDSAFRLHQVLCTVKLAPPDGIQAATIAAVVPSVSAPAGATDASIQVKLPDDDNIKSETSPVPTDPGVHDSEMTNTHSEPVSLPAPADTFNMNGSEIFYPTIDPYFMVSQFVADALDDTLKLSRIHPTNLLITGMAGGGKTSVALQLAAREHRPAVVADFGVLQEPQQLFQTTHLIQSESGVITETRESAFIRGIETQNCVVIIDEMNRVENERCLNPLMPLLDGRKSTWIDELRRRIHVADGVIFIATINEGSQFAGVASLDAALRDRFREIFIDYLPAEQESLVIQNKTGVPKLIANSLAEFGYVVRHTDAISRKISTRQLLHAADTYSVGAPLWRAVETAVGNYNDVAWRQDILEVFSLNIKDPDEYAKWLGKSRHDSYVEYK